MHRAGRRHSLLVWTVQPGSFPASHWKNSLRLYADKWLKELPGLHSWSLGSRSWDDWDILSRRVNLAPSDPILAAPDSLHKLALTRCTGSTHRRPSRLDTDHYVAGRALNTQESTRYLSLAWVRYMDPHPDIFETVSDFPSGTKKEVQERVCTCMHQLSRESHLRALQLYE